MVTDRLRPLRVQDRTVHQVWVPYHWGYTGLVTGDAANDLFGIALDPNVLIQESKVTTCDVRPGRRPQGKELLSLVDGYRRRAGVTPQHRHDAGHHRPGSRPAAPGHRARPVRGGGGPVNPLDDVAGAAGYPADHPPRKGFFTDTSICIGCKACEVACKEWNLVPDDGFDLLGMSYDNTGALGASTWRHVAFVEQEPPTARTPVDLGMPSFSPPGAETGAETRQEFRWLMASDVCKHCTHAGCLDVCPTGALFRTEFGTVVVQQDICNGCGYCVSGCPYGVIDRREGDGRAWKCTLCYDRLHDGLEPACAQACPTQSIQYGDLDELRERARGAGGRAARPRARPRPGSTARTRPTASAATARSSCCWTSRRCTGCRRTRWCPPGTCPGCGGWPARPRWRWRRPRRRSSAGAGERVGPAPAAARRRRPGRWWPGWWCGPGRWWRPGAVDGAAGRVPLVLRAADPQDPGLGREGRVLHLPGRAVRRQHPARRRRRPHRAARAAPRQPGHRAGRPARRDLLPRRRPGPAGALPPHAPGGQADLAAERRHLAPGRVRPRRSGWPPSPSCCRPGCAAPRSAGWPARWPGRATWPRPGSRRRWRRTPRCCCPRPRCRPGTRPGTSCRSSSPGARRPARPGSACWWRRSPRPARRAGWPATARWSSWSPGPGWSSGWGWSARPYRTGTAGRYVRAAQLLTAAGGLGATLLGRRSRLGRRRVRGRPGGRRAVRAARRAARRHPVHKGPEVRGRAAAAADRRARPHPYRGARWGRS